ncbi:MAG: 2-amino-4-hydroxy-6-hydroxymethyldihydropteridine diphosphokinase [Clostridiales bacterium]
MVKAYLGLGCNLGDKRFSMKKAIGLLKNMAGVKKIKCSSLYETKPWGLADQPVFYNGVVEMDYLYSPGELLVLCWQIEAALNRQRVVKWGPRTMDVDILLYGQEKINNKDLIIPHPYLHERDFVLWPLAEIAPDLTIPGRGSLRQLLGELSTDGLQIIAKPDAW